MPRKSSSATLVEWGIAARTCPGHAVSGDAGVAKPFAGGVLLAVVDGLGRDTQAALAARTASDVLEKYAAGSVVSLIKRCHKRLMMTRGAVMTVASVDLRSNLNWLGIGNVEGLVVRADPTMVPAVELLRPQGGVVGYQLPILEPRRVMLNPGDLLALTTDGICGDMLPYLRHKDSPQHLAERVLERRFCGNDDALVLVARYLGVGHE